MWTLYDRLIALAADDDFIEECVFGESWTMVTTKAGFTGVAAAHESRTGEPADAKRFVGMNTALAAKLVKSWDFAEASLGLAVINARVNRRERFASDGKEADAFIRYKGRVAGKKVAVIGRFAYLERRLDGICDMYVLERKPGKDDYPDPACEYILPDMDCVFITGSAALNKTMPRLLELSKNAFTVISGPSTTMDDVYFELGADSLCGFCVTDSELCRKAALNNAGIFACGLMVCREK